MKTSQSPSTSTDNSRRKQEYPSAVNRQMLIEKVQFMKRAFASGVLLVLVPIFVFAQSIRDSVSLKDGRILSGTIIEQKVDDYVKLKLENGIVTEIPFNEITSITQNGEKIYGMTTEIKSDRNNIEMTPQEMSANMMKYEQEKKNPALAVYLALMLPSAGHAYAGNWVRGLTFLAGEVGGFVVVGVSAIAAYPSKDHTFVSISMVGLLLIKLWEFIDAWMEVEKYNSNLHNSIFQKLSDTNINLRLSQGFANSYNIGFQIGL